METIIGSAYLFKEFESHVKLDLDLVIAFQPVIREIPCLRTEGVSAVSAEGMPVSYRKAKDILHLLSAHLCLGVIPFKCQGIL